MDKNEFLKKLREALKNSLEKSEVDAHIDYYDKYISDEMAKGRTEKDVLNELGDPTLIAKTIKTVSGTENVVDADIKNEENNKKTKTTYMYTTDTRTTIGCVIAILLAFIFIILIFRFLGVLLLGTAGLAFGLGPVGILIIILLIYFLSGRR